MLLPAAVLFSLMIAVPQDAARVIPLWPEGVPGAKADGGEERVVDGRVYNVQRPTLQHFPAPAETATGTAVIICPGGGYARLAIDNEGGGVARVLNAMGVSVFVLKYRLVEYGHPAPLQDVLRAVRLVRSRAAEFGVRADRVGIFGASAGGHLAAAAATLFDAPEGRTGAPLDAVGARPDFIALLYPVISLQPPYGHEGSRRNLLGPSPADSLVEGLSLERRVRPDSPPAFLVHTAEDAGVPAENSILFYQALRRAKVPAELHLYEKGTHGFGLAKGLGPTSDWPKRLEEWMRAHGWLERRDSRVAWAEILRQPEAWYGSADARAIADSVLLYQRESGGWPKDIDMTRPPAPAAAKPARPDATIDNHATVLQMRLLARTFRAAGDARDRDAVLRAVDYLLAAQYPNGGWPQFFPLRQDYSRYVTFNDDALVHTADVLDEIAGGAEPFGFVDAARRERAGGAVGRAVDVILHAQVKVNGRLTAWCAQHDEATLAPRGARTYEHPSLSGAETVGIVRFLMRRGGGDARTPAAVEAAVAWLESVKLQGWRLVERRDASLPGGVDKVLVQDASAPPLWARFYDINTNTPIYSGRDGVIRATLAEIEHERRVGYAWVGDWPRALLENEYPAWKAGR